MLAEHVLPTLHVAASLPVSVTDDVAAARAQAAEQFTMYG